MVLIVWPLASIKDRVLIGERTLGNKKPADYAGFVSVLVWLDVLKPSFGAEGGHRKINITN